MSYCYNYESVTVRKWQLPNNRFLYSRLKKVAPFISVKYLKSEYQKIRRCPIPVANAKLIGERAYCLTFMQSSNNWRKECKYSRNIANVHTWRGRGGAFLSEKVEKQGGRGVSTIANFIRT